MEELELKRTSETIGANCPLCGGSIEIGEGIRSIKCSYCGSSLYLAQPVGVKNFIAYPRIKEGTAKHAALRLILDKSSGSIGGKDASIFDCTLVFVPFWRLHGKLIGWIAGEKSNKEVVEEFIPGPHGSRIKRFKMGTKNESFSRFVFKEVDWSAPASHIPHLPLHGVSFKASSMKWNLLDHSIKAEHCFALPSKTEDKAREEAFRYLTSLTAPPGTSVRYQRFNMFDSELSLYFYPIYFVRYAFKKRIFTISVDGVSGKVIRGQFPEIVKGSMKKNMVKVPLAAAMLSAIFLPLPLLVLAAMYAIDCSSSRTWHRPIDWFMMRAAGWFSEENGG